MTQLIADSLSRLLGADALPRKSLMLLPPTGGFFLGVTHALNTCYLGNLRHYSAWRSHLISTRTGRCAMAAFNVGAIVQMKSGGIHGVVDSQLEPDSDHPKAWVRWDDGNYSVHPENELRPATVDGPQLYKTLEKEVNPCANYAKTPSLT